MYTFEELRNIIARLRSEDGCPWDREQTFESLKNVWPTRRRKSLKRWITTIWKTCARSWAIYCSR